MLSNIPQESQEYRLDREISVVMKTNGVGGGECYRLGHWKGLRKLISVFSSEILIQPWRGLIIAGGVALPR